MSNEKQTDNPRKWDIRIGENNGETSWMNGWFFLCVLGLLIWSHDHLDPLIAAAITIATILKGGS